MFKLRHYCYTRVHGCNATLLQHDTTLPHYLLHYYTGVFQHSAFTATTVLLLQEHQKKIIEQTTQATLHAHILNPTPNSNPEVRICIRASVYIHTYIYIYIYIYIWEYVESIHPSLNRGILCLELRCCSAVGSLRGGGGGIPEALAAQPVPAV